MKVIVHDLQETSWQDLGIRFNERDVIIGKAAYNDKYSTSSSIAEVIGNCCQLVLISVVCMEGLVRLFKKCWNAAEIGLGHFWKCGMDRHTMRFRMKTKIFWPGLLFLWG